MFAFTVAAPSAVVTTSRDTAPVAAAKTFEDAPANRGCRCEAPSRYAAARDSLHSRVAAPAGPLQVVQAMPVVLRIATPA